MPETSPTAVFYGSSKPDVAKPMLKEQSPMVKRVRKAVDSWIDRVGQHDVEQHFIDSHERVLKTFTSQKRKDAYKKSADMWRKTGKVLGITATALDLGTAALGLVLTAQGLRNPDITQAYVNNNILNPIFRHMPENNWLYRQYDRLFDIPYGGDYNEWAVRLDARQRSVGQIEAVLPALGSLAIIAKGGPGHLLAHAVAGIAETVEKSKARSVNNTDKSNVVRQEVKKASADVRKPGLKR